MLSGARANAQARDRNLYWPDRPRSAWTKILQRGLRKAIRRDSEAIRSSLLGWPLNGVFGEQNKTQESGVAHSCICDFPLTSYLDCSTRPLNCWLLSPIIRTDLISGAPPSNSTTSQVFSF